MRSVGLDRSKVPCSLSPHLCGTAGSVRSGPDSVGVRQRWCGTDRVWCDLEHPYCINAPSTKERGRTFLVEGRVLCGLMVPRRAARGQQAEKFSLCASLGDENGDDRWRTHVEYADAF